MIYKTKWNRISPSYQVFHTLWISCHEIYIDHVVRNDHFFTTIDLEDFEGTDVIESWKWSSREKIDEQFF